MRARALLPWLLLPLACSRSGGAEPGRPAESPEELAARMESASARLMERTEHGAGEVTVQHVLVAVGGPGVPGVARTSAEARARSAEVFARAHAGEDFDTLVKNYSDDLYPCLTTLSLAGSSGPEVFPRSRMPAAFGDLAWRLEVGEVGAAIADGSAEEGERAAHGYLVLKRLK